MKIQLDSMALAMPRLARHPNRLAFRGVLTLVDVPSDRAPAGSRGHRVILSRAAAERAIPSLLGMGLDFTASFDGHDARRKVGIITSADIVPLSRVEQAFRPAFSSSRRAGASAPEVRPAALIISGFLFARDFPDVVRDLRLHAGALGMSYEIAEARIADPGARIWTITEAVFTGAAVLRRDKAAYSQTSIELATDYRPPTTEHQENKMNPELTQQFVETASRLAAASASLEEALARLDSSQQSLAVKVDRIIATVEENAGARSIVQLEARIAELERANSELKAQAARVSARKTLPPMVTAILAKSGFDATSDSRLDAAALDKALTSLSVEQRIAVKSQMARAGMIE